MALTRPDDRVRLNAWARTFLDGTPKLLYHEVVTRFYPDGSSTQSEPKKIFGSADLPQREPCGERFAAVYPLYRYQFSDGRTYREFVHMVAKDANGASVYLLGLQTEDGKQIIDSLWGLPELQREGLSSSP